MEIGSDRVDSKVKKEVLKSCYYYFLFELTTGRFAEAECFSAWDIEIQLKDGSIMKMTFLTYQDANPAAIRFTLPCEQDDVVPEKFMNMIQESKEHFLSIYKLNYDADAYFKICIWNFDHQPSIDLRTDVIITPPNSEVLRNSVASSFKYRHSLKLISDAQDERIPIQYRYLSLFLFLEEEFKYFGKWDYSKVNKALESTNGELKKLGLDRKPLSTFIDIRDRCAHIKSDKNIRGITQLSNKDAVLVTKVLPILTEACRIILNTKTDGAFELRSRNNEIKSQ